MRKIVSALAATAIAGMMAISGPAHSEEPLSKGEQRLAKMLEGREAGEPVSCIGLFDSHNLRTINKTALVYKRGGTIWVNRPANPKALRSSNVLVIKRTGSRLCKMDHVTTVDQSTHMFSGAVFLGDFVPYRKVG